MSDTLKEECGLALVRLRKPLEYYADKYNTSLWGFHKLFLLMEKQHNRGHDGAGVGSLKLDMPPGEPYMFRDREISHNSLSHIFNGILGKFNQLENRGLIDASNPASVKQHFDYGAEIYMGHLRYGTSGGYNTSSCHPYFRKNNWPTKNLLMAGNFTLTNTRFLNNQLIDRGQHPIFDTDTQTLLEEIGFYLDKEHDNLFKAHRNRDTSGPEIAQAISRDMNVEKILKRSSRNWDGGYSLVGIIGNGDTFAIRDPRGIRPLHVYQDEEVIAFASERAPLMTVFNSSRDNIEVIKPGEAFITKKDGSIHRTQINPARKELHCSFERIYFSRGNDPDIYQERKAMGAALAKPIRKAIKTDLHHTVLSFIPNTAEIAYYGLLEQFIDWQQNQLEQKILDLSSDGQLNADNLKDLFTRHQVKIEKVAWKDIKLRTFISQEEGRNKLASHVYDVSYGSVNPEDTLVVVDDSIVRGTTLKQSIIKILARLNPKKIIIASTAPQIRYPDCYGIDMSQLEKFIAFQAVLSLIKENGKQQLLTDVYEACKVELEKPENKMENMVKRLYDEFSTREISDRIASLVTPELDFWNGEVQIIFQSIEDLHKSLKTPCGDWYFTGRYPTPADIES